MKVTKSPLVRKMAVFLGLSPVMDAGVAGYAEAASFILDEAASLRGMTDSEILRVVRKTASEISSAMPPGKCTADISTATPDGKKALRKTILAAACEVARRVLGYTVHSNQVEAALAMTDGHIAEMPTGEGKTLSAALAAAWLAYAEGGVHILTFNDYLAERDCLWMGPLCPFLGLTAGHVTGSSSRAERQAAYGADVVWLTAREAGFDHLRDGLVMSAGELVQRPLHAAIVDECDSLLIDEARIPMVLAGGGEAAAGETERICQAVSTLSRSEDLMMDRNEQQVTLSDLGIRKMERQLGCENLYSGEETDLLARVHAALTARFLLKRDRDYILRDDAVLLVDPHTGRVALNRHWPVLLQEAVEVKEGLAPSRNGIILGTITTRHFVRQYRHLSGMTGTALTSARELDAIYGLKTIVIAPHAPPVRIDHPDTVHATLEDKWTAVCREICSNHACGRPILVGTVDVAESEKLALRLTELGVPCQVLNARNDREEAAVIAEAGRPGAVTVSTNMAGRGVDIRLGGSDQSLRPEAVAAGGLLVLGTSRHEHRRVDKQLRGRAGRQGDPGESRFHVSLEDDLFVRNDFAELLPERAKLRLREGTADPVHDPAFAKAMDVGQRLMEGYHEDIRGQLAKYADMPEQQRLMVRAARMAVLAGAKPEPSPEGLNPVLHAACVERNGEEAADRFERRLWLTLLDRRWADCIGETASVREGVHLVAFGNLNPLDVFHQEIIAMFDSLWFRLAEDLSFWLREMVSETGEIREEHEWPAVPSATWTYLVLDTPDQFSRLPHLVKSAAAAVSGPLVALLAWAERRKASKSDARTKI